MDSVTLIRLALEVISDRLITILALSMSCGLACYTMWGRGLDKSGNIEYIRTIQLSNGNKQGEK